MLYFISRNFDEHSILMATFLAACGTIQPMISNSFYKWHLNIFSIKQKFGGFYLVGLAEKWGSGGMEASFTILYSVKDLRKILFSCLLIFCIMLSFEKMLRNKNGKGMVVQEKQFLKKVVFR